MPDGVSWEGEKFSWLGEKKFWRGEATIWKKRVKEHHLEKNVIDGGQLCGLSAGIVFQVKGTATAKALGQELASTLEKQEGG